MGNSIFDDDDGFSLSGGIEGEDPKPQVKKAPVAPAPSRTAGSQRPTSQMPEVRRAAPPRPAGGNSPAQQPAPLRRRSNGGLPTTPTGTGLPPVNKLATKPAGNPLSTTSLPSAPIKKNPQTSLPQAISAPPIKREQQKSVVTPPEPVYQEPVAFDAPTEVEPENISYSDAVEENIHENYNPPVSYDPDEEERLEEERRAEERRLRRQRALEAEREEERREEEERLKRKQLARERAEREEQEELEAQEAKKPTRNSKAQKGKSPARKPARGKKEAVEKEPGKFAGERRKILILRVIALGVLAVFVFAGLKATFIPAKGPTARQVIATVKDGIGMTNFPTQTGEGFVLAFSKIYLTVPKDGGGERAKLLAPYASTTVINDQQFSSVPSAADIQTVTGGPYISGVLSKDDKNAVYTVTAQLNNLNWVYIDVPVFYDDTTKTFAISGTPAFVPAPQQAKLDPQPKPWNNDDPEAVKIFTPAAELFFKAWANSNTQEMLPYQTDDADAATKTGLNGAVKFDSISKVSIEPADGLSDPNTRKARVTVRWENAYAPKTFYSQTYDLVLVKVPDAKQWRIKSLVGGITSETN